jgi:5-methylcytosine-specific restriction endonuclease McrA|tara:strand:+ start:918 stop:1277 length:360 start_codon:yes stop_codon:yes gene_type:complete
MVKSKFRNRVAGKGKNTRKKSNLKTGRNYTYDKKYAARPDQKKNRAKRNTARKQAIKAGKVRLGDRTRDVDHKKPLSKGGSNKKSNLRVMSASKNRAKKNKTTTKRKTTRKRTTKRRKR